MTRWRRIRRGGWRPAALFRFHAMFGDQLAPIAFENGMDFLPYRLYPIYILDEIDAR
ncbi:msl2214 [Mesorhizobium japonicum MAFF 303099]|uniref:Msl2214 protein n=1 Tax=Mesorhizobium japonicum (strain LMG 29417 / CECT 9101 / MAFF 303099) TaxID=266835 RepID=Q98IW8_RHILO|nr:msl2214 [Mesorhizobium japonicum MAFF 303099]